MCSRRGWSRTTCLPRIRRTLSPLSYAPSSRCAVVKVLAFVDPVGFEPTASWVQTRRSSVLELQAHRRDGGTRTPNPRIPNPVRYRCATSRWSRRRCTGGRDRTPACWVGASRAPTTPRPFEGKRKGPLLREESPQRERGRTTSSRNLRSARAANPRVDPYLGRARRRQPRYRGAASLQLSVLVSSFPRS